MLILVAGVTFLLVTGVVIWIVLLTTRGSRQTDVIRQRLAALDQADRRASASAELELLRSELLSDIPHLHRLLKSWGWARSLRAFITQAGMRTKPGVLVLWCGVLGVGGYVIARNVLGSVLLGAAIGAACLPVPLLIVAFKRMRRLHAFEKVFPEAIDLLARAVRAGHAFTTGMEMIAKELPEPVAGEFRTTFEQQNFGLPLRDALLNQADRVPIIDVRFFVIALMIQKESGGNLAEILDNLSRVIRERFKILGEVRIKTAQGRLTAGILMALPLGMLAMMGVLNPGYVGVLFTDVWGPYMLAGAVFLQILGSVMLWKIVQIKV